MPSGAVEVPVVTTVYDMHTVFNTTTVAGSIGLGVVKYDAKDGVTVQPISGWWSLEDSSKGLDQGRSQAHC
jgi:hypothetical protein